MANEEHGKSAEHGASAGHGKSDDAHGKKPNKKQKTVDTWVAKGWTPCHMLSGASASDPIALDPASQELEVLGQIFDVDGKPIHGHFRPHVRVVEGTDSATISFASPLTQNVTLLYKIEDAGTEDADSFDDQTM